MFESSVAQWQQLPLLGGLLIAFALQLLIYLAMVGGVYTIYGGLRRGLSIGELLDNRPRKPHQIRHEVFYSLSTCAVLGVYTLICLHISNSVWASSWLVGFAQVAAFVLLYDFFFYWWHRLLHQRLLAPIHGKHHYTVQVTPWAIHSLHPLEAAVSYLPVVLFAVACNPGIGTVVLAQFVLFFPSIGGHANYNPFGSVSAPAWLKQLFGFHQAHHTFGRYNFSFSMFWDKIFGTAYQQGHP